MHSSVFKGQTLWWWCWEEGPLSTLLHLFAKLKKKKKERNKVEGKRKEPRQLLLWMFWMGAIG